MPRAAEIGLSVAALASASFLAAALLQGRVQLRGWLYDAARDEVLAADPQTGRFTRRAALDPSQNRLFRKERLRSGPPRALPWRDLSSRYLA